MAASERKQVVTPEKVRQIVSSFFSNKRSSAQTYGDNESGEEIHQDSTSEESSGKKTSLELRSKEAYFNRIETYSLLSWFAKPIELAPPVCAQYGWENTEKDTLQCIGCKAVLYADLPPVDDDTYRESCETLKNNLTSCHVKSCSWSSNPSSESYKQIPVYDQKAIRNEFRERLNQLKKMTDSLPHINYESLQNWNFCSNRSAQFAYHVEKLDTDPVKAATVLAVTGWTGSGKSDIIMCCHCFRHVGLWNFKSIAPGQDASHCHGDEDEDGSSDEPAAKRPKIQTKMDFDPIAEHRNWCPWIALTPDLTSPSKSVGREEDKGSVQESTSGTSVQRAGQSDTTGHPGWLQVVQILAPRLLNASNISLAKSLKQSPIVAGLRSIRHLFSDWTTSPATNR